MTDKEWLIIVIALGIGLSIGIPLLGSILQLRDFRAQISGKKPVRKINHNFDSNAVVRDMTQKKSDYESMKTIAELKSKQNILGPK